MNKNAWGSNSDSKSHITTEHRLVLNYEILKLTVYTVHYDFLKVDIIFYKLTESRFVPANDGKLSLKLLINETLRTNLRVLQKNNYFNFI